MSWQELRSLATRQQCCRKGTVARSLYFSAGFFWQISCQGENCS